MSPESKIFEQVTRNRVGLKITVGIIENCKNLEIPNLAKIGIFTHQITLEIVINSLSGRIKKNSGKEVKF